MSRSLAIRPILGVVLFLALLLSAQSQEPEPAQDKGNPATTEKKKQGPEGLPLTLDKMKVPKDSILVVVEEIKKALAMVPNAVIMSPEKYQELLDRIQMLEKQLKPEKEAVYSCKLEGKLENDFVLLRADFTFITFQPHAVVPLGLQGASLDEGDPDQQVPALYYGEEGFFLKVAEPGTHKLTLHVKAKVGLRRSTTGGGGERGFELDLPGASVTTLLLDMPKNIKEIRWNDGLPRKRQSNRWELSLGTIKKLNVSWKEPVHLAGAGPMLSAEGQITVTLEENSTLLKADLVLEDLRGEEATEWHLLLPAQAKVDIKAPGGVVPDLLPPEGKNPAHILKFPEPYGERFTVQVQVRYPRPPGAYRLPVGPFFVLNAFRQQGTIEVQAGANSMRGQRLIFHRYGEVFQRDIPKSAAGKEVLAVFHYWNMAGKTPLPKGPPTPKVPLEIEWKVEKGLVEATLENELKLMPGAEGPVVEFGAHIKVKSLYPGLEYLDVQLPRAHTPLASVWAWCPTAAFPAGVAWSVFLEKPTRQPPLAWPTEFDCEEEGPLVPDGQGKARIKFSRPTSSKEFTLHLKGKYLVPGGVQRFRVELPRVLGVADRGGKVNVTAEPGLEMLVGPAGVEEPIPEKQSLQTAWNPASPFLDLAWRPYQPRLAAESLVDITLRGKHAHLRQQLSFAWPVSARRESVGTGRIRLRVPMGIKEAPKISGGTLQHDADRGLAWVEPAATFPAKEPLVLEYDQVLPAHEKAGASWQVPLIWPDGATHLQAKVRIWSEPGILPEVVDLADLWRDQGIEVVTGRDALPVLVLQGSGVKLDLALRLPASAPSRLPVLVCDRGLIQVTVDEAGNHHYRARYFLQKLNTESLDMEWPAPINVESCLQNVYLGGYKIPWKRDEQEKNVARLEIKPEIFRQNMLLDVEYKLPPSFTEGKHYWQTMLFPPQFRGEVFLGRVRWLVHLPSQWMSVLSASNIQIDFHWTIQGWLLTTEPSVTSAEVEQWLVGKSATEPDFPVSQAFSRSSQEPVMLVHLPRQTWLLICSGLFLVGGLLLYFVPLSRTLFWVVLVGLGLVLVGAGFWWPTWVPSLLFGIQPGVVVLAIILTVHWLLQERYRRQVIFMPGFTRLKTGSSLLRNGGTNTRPREASTVDAPPPSSGQGRGSSINQGASGV